jgi:hypothetical protein
MGLLRRFSPRNDEMMKLEKKIASSRNFGTHNDEIGKGIASSPEASG